MTVVYRNVTENLLCIWVFEDHGKTFVFAAGSDIKASSTPKSMLTCSNHCSQVSPMNMGKTAVTVGEAFKLLEVGFDYVTDVEGVKLFRKRK